MLMPPIPMKYIWMGWLKSNWYMKKSSVFISFDLIIYNYTIKTNGIFNKISV